MTTRMLAAFLAVLMLPFAGLASKPDAAKEERQAIKRAELALKVKQGIAELGTGRDARVSVKTRDKRKLEGYIGEINEEAFTVVGLESNESTTVQYSDVAKVQGNNLATGWKIAIGVGIGVGVFFAVLVIVYIAQGGG